MEHFTAGWSQRIDQRNFRLVVERRPDTGGPVYDAMIKPTVSPTYCHG